MHRNPSPGDTRQRPPLDRAGWIVVGVAALFLSLAGAFLLLHLVGPSDGARLDPGQPVWKPDGVVVTPLEEQSDGLRAGDVVVAVDGRGMESWAGALFELTTSRPTWQHGESITYTVLRDGRQLEVPIALGRYPIGAVVRNNWGTILFALVSQLVATFVFIRRADAQAARVLLLWASSILSATTWSLGLQVSDLVNGIGFWLFQATGFFAYTLFWIAGLHFALVFPRQLPIVLKSPWIMRSLYVVPYVLYLGYLAAAWPGASSTLDWLGRWGPGSGVLASIYLALMVITVIWGYRTNRDAGSRRKIRWVVFAAFVSGGGGLLLWLLPPLVLGRSIIGANTLGILVLPFPLALAVAIMRHRLFDIDLIINRTLVYGALTASTMGIYVLIVGYLGGLVQERDRSVIAFLTTGLVAVLFQPLRQRLQRGVNRLMYGERDDPYAVLSRLGKGLEGTLVPQSVLPTIAEMVAQTLKLPYVALALKQGEEFKIATAYGQPRGDPIRLPLVYQGEAVGQLIVAPRALDEAFTASEQRLLEDIGHQAGVAVHAVRLTADLQRSRERLVTAREEERRRLRRDLHDGLGPELASLSLKLEAARNLIDRDPNVADSLLAELKTQVQEAIADIRRLV
ncbi:MAG: histidine kinase, partial [Anaerolineales bacterium]